MDFTPNWELLKHPYNWFVVGFSLFILFALLHLALRDKTGANA